MSKTSSEVKRRYNKANYKQLNIFISFELNDRLDAYREKHNLSRPAFLELALDTLENSPSGAEE